MFDLVGVDLPALKDPVLVVALRGWIDAGRCGQGVLTYLTEHMEGAVDVAELDLTPIADLLHDRPEVRVVDGLVTSLTWPSLAVTTGNAGRDVVAVSGPEPARGWRPLVHALVGLARRAGVVEAVCVGGIPAGVTHHEEVRVLSTATDARTAERVGDLRPDYQGPTGLQTCLQVALAEQGVPCAGLWAQVPPYVAATPSPPAVGAVLERMREVAAVEVDTSALAGEIAAYTAAVDARLAERPDLAELVRKLQQAVGGVEPDEDASGLVREIERYLREFDDDS
ncbi:MAG: PAC2 family protein [Acidimicrobiia bacterium]